MPIKPFVCRPERINHRRELDEILGRMDIYAKESGYASDKVGVLMIQNRQLGAIYEITSREEAEIEIGNPYNNGGGKRTSEWGVKFYPRSFFEELKMRLPYEEGH